jgi:hypothetical protein
MKYKIFLFSFFCFVSSPAFADSPYDFIQVSAGAQQSCYLDEADNIDCRPHKHWEYYEQSRQIPKVRNPKQVVVGTDFTCALDDDGVRCWGSDKYSIAQVPALKNPKQISASDDTVCALDDEGIKCWGLNRYGKVPALQNPRQVSTGGLSACALNDTGLVCWGNGFDDQYRPKLNSPQQVSVGANHVCVLDQGEVKCWRDGRYEPLTVPALKNPRQISCGRLHTCVLDGDGVKCWWARERNKSFFVPPFQNPKFVSAGEDRTCVVDNTGLICWLPENTANIDNHGISEVPLIFNLESLKFSSSLPHLNYYGYLKSAEASLANAEASVRNEENKYFFYSLLNPSVENTFSEYFATSLKPRYKNFISSLAQYSEHPNNVEDSVERRQIALKHIQAAIQVSLEFLPPAEKDKLQAVIKKIGTAYSEANDANLKAVLLALEENQSTIDSLKNSERSAFLVDVIHLSADWLKAKVP